MSKAESNLIALQKRRILRRSSVYLFSGLLLGGLGMLRSDAQQIFGGLSSATTSAYVCFNCIANPDFMVRSYQGQSRCLDYTPEKSGSPVFINDCTLAHPVIVEEIADGKHTVVLHAGTKVIGTPAVAALTEVGTSVASQNITSLVIQGGTSGTTQGATPTPATAETPLELQDSGLAGTFSSNHRFALDGDSIILASHRDLVAKVQNARGAIGTPVVLGHRNLADNEFWDFVATDGSDRDPTSGFVRIGYPGDPLCPDDNSCIRRLYSVVSTAGPGTVVRVGRSLNVTGQPPLFLKEGVTVRGDRRGPAFGAELSRDFDGSSPLPDMFDVEADDVRITGLRLRGPSRSPDTDQANSTGVFVNPDSDANGRFIREFLRTVVDHNDISNFTYGGVRVFDGLDRKDQCDPNSKDDPQTRPFNTRVVRNFIHHNEEQGNGYGVEPEQGGYALIEGNTFVSNRHAIASDGRATSGYKAVSNLVLSYAPVQYGAGIWPFHTQDFDMHGVGPNGFTGIGGDYVGIFGNTFLGTNRPNFELRGGICNYVDYKNNVSLESQDDAVQLSTGPFCGLHCWGGAISAQFNISPEPPQFEHSNPTDRRGAFGVGDFDGDGADDLFVVTGAGWYYSSAGQAEWRFLSP